MGAEPADGQAEEPGDRAPGRRRATPWIAGGVALAIVVFVAILLAHGGGKPAAAPSTPVPTTLPLGARVPFEFRLTSVTETSYTGKQSEKATRRTAELVRTLLSRWYDAAFFDPAEWKQGPPASAWRVFRTDVASRARRQDAAALTLGTVKGLEGLEASGSRLYVRVLLDPSLHTVAVVATISLDAQGTLQGGDLLKVSNEARFILRVVGSRWTIVAYPDASTKAKQVPAPLPTLSPGPSASAPASP
jgi:hypothetical protein